MQSLGSLDWPKEQAKQQLRSWSTEGEAEQQSESWEVDWLKEGATQQLQFTKKHLIDEGSLSLNTSKGYIAKRARAYPSLVATGSRSARFLNELKFWLVFGSFCFTNDLQRSFIQTESRAYPEPRVFLQPHI